MVVDTVEPFSESLFQGYVTRVLHNLKLCFYVGTSTAMRLSRNGRTISIAF